MSAIVNNYHRSRKFGLRKKATKEWLYKSKQDSIFFTTGKNPNPTFNSIEDAQKFVRDQAIILRRSRSIIQRGHDIYWARVFGEEDEEEAHYDETSARSHPHALGQDLEVTFYTLKEFTLFFYDIDKILEYEIAACDRSNKRR